MAKKAVQRIDSPSSVIINTEYPVKKTTKKKTTKKKTSSNSNTDSKTTGVDKVLLENFVGLQKVMTDVAMRLDLLSNQTSQLLGLFESSAKALAQKGGIQLNIDDKLLIEKMDNLIEQNKTIARGVSLLHEPSESSPQQTPSNPQQFSQKPKPLLKPNFPRQEEVPHPGQESFQRSNSPKSSPKQVK